MEGWQWFYSFIFDNFYHRFSECLRLKGVSGGHLFQPLVLKQRHLDLVAQDHIQMAFEYPQGGRPYYLSGQPVPVLGRPRRTEVFAGVQREPSVFQFVLSASGPATGYHWKEPGSVLMAPSLQVLLCSEKTHPELSLLQAEQSQLSQPLLIGEMLQSVHHHSGPALHFLQYVHVSSVLGSPELGTEL